jgi:Leucine-rich repeat (LRR) protein
MEGILRVLRELDGITHLSFGEALGATPAVDGTIPYTLTSFPQLQSFYTGQNKGVHGTIPSECGQLSQLQTFRIGSSKISGTLPSELGGMTKLNHLGIQCTHLTGTIPTELGRLVRLVSMHLGCHNKLTGTIPTELGNLANLDTISLYNNLLTGQIPAQLTQLPLTKLRVNGNQLSGTVPVFNFALFANSTCGHVDAPGCCLSGSKPSSNRFSCPLPEGASLACHATCK